MVRPKLSSKLKKMRDDLRGKIIVEGMDKRNIVLNDALVLEGMTKMMIGPLMGIKHKKDDNQKAKQQKKSIKEKRLPLSFDQMLVLLIHLDVVEEKHYPKLYLFGEIRNQMVHNWEASTFVKCFQFLKGKKEKLLEYYPQHIRWSEERKLELAVRALGKECRTIIGDIANALFTKMWNEASKEQALKQYEFNAVREAAYHTIIQVQDALQEIVKEKGSLTNKDVRLFPKWMMDVWDHHFHEELNSLIKTDKTREQLAIEEQQDQAGALKDSVMENSRDGADPE